MPKKYNLTEGPIGSRLLRMTLPMTVGMFSMVAYNLTDTYFISRLGTEQLAAISFTFPVVLIIHCISLGLSIGASSVIARAIGEGDFQNVKRLTTDSVLLVILIVGLLAALGFLFMEPLFRLIGATPSLMPMIREYMSIWFAGLVITTLPMTMNHSIRAAGDMRDPSLIMLCSAALNALLDPLFIFGIGIFPAMGIAGAAWASVLSRAVTLIGSFSVLHFRHRMLTIERPGFSILMRSWGRLLHVGLPNAATSLLFPLSMGVFTRLVAQFGKTAVAGVGAAGKVEALATMVLWALGAALTPFVGQNWGAGRLDRLLRAKHMSSIFALGWGVFSWIALILFARPIAGIFSEETDVVRAIVLYLWIMPVSFGMQGVSMCVGLSYNAIGKPLYSSSLNVIRTFVLFLPMIWLGAKWFGFIGLLYGAAFSHICAGLLALFWQRYVYSFEKAFSLYQKKENRSVSASSG